MEYAELDASCLLSVCPACEALIALPVHSEMSADPTIPAYGREGGRRAAAQISYRLFFQCVCGAMWHFEDSYYLVIGGRG